MTIKEFGKFVRNGRYMKGMFRKSEVEIISIENPAEDYYVVKLKPEPDFYWRAGEHATFEVPTKNIEGGDSRIFSIASVSDEGHILLGMRTKEQISNYKKELLSMKKGEKLSMTGPFGWFRIRDNVTPMVMYASGVGVTPIRGLLKFLEKDTSRPVEIVYASNTYYLFGEEIEQIVRNNSAMTLCKTVTREETQEKLAQLADKYENTAYYYISAAPAVIESVRSLLHTKGIQNERIIDDTLTGY